MGKTTAVIAWGRFQPPTKGHDVIVKQLKDVGKEYANTPDTSQVSLFLFTSQTQDNQKNPLTYEKKIDVLDKLYGRSIHIRHNKTNIKTIIDVAAYIDEQGFDNLVVIVGSDRVLEFRELMNKYNGKEDKKGRIPYTFDLIEVRQAGEQRSESGMSGMIDPDEASDSDLSASAARKAAIDGNLQAFTKIFAQGDLAESDQQKLAKEVFNILDSVYGVTPLEEPEDNIAQVQENIRRDVTFAMESRGHDFPTKLELHMCTTKSAIKMIESSSYRDLKSITENHKIGIKDQIIFLVEESLDKLEIKDVLLPNLSKGVFNQYILESLDKDLEKDRLVLILSESFATTLALVAQKAQSKGAKVNFKLGKSHPDSLFNNTPSSFDFRSSIAKQGIRRTPPSLRSLVSFA